MKYEDVPRDKTTQRNVTQDRKVTQNVIWLPFHYSIIFVTKGVFPFFVV